MDLTGHWVVSNGDEDNTEELCAGCDEFIPPIADAMMFCPEDLKTGCSFYCMKCYDSGVG